MRHRIDTGTATRAMVALAAMLLWGMSSTDQASAQTTYARRAASYTYAYPATTTTPTYSARYTANAGAYPQYTYTTNTASYAYTNATQTTQAAPAYNYTYATAAPTYGYQYQSNYYAPSNSTAATYAAQPTQATAGYDTSGATYAAASTGYTGGDAYGFLGWLNSVRAQYGLPSVGYDASLESWAAANSAQQASRGLGHYVMGPARRQNSAVGSSGSIGSMWMNSPAHRAALLDPSIRYIGLAAYGSYWTFNAY